MPKLKLNASMQVGKDEILLAGTVINAPQDDKDLKSLVARGFATCGVPLDPANPGHFTKDGKPDVKALSDKLGAKVSAALRDESWVTLQA